MALRNQPYLPLYVQDFLTDEKLAECTASATGVYIRLMCLMHKSEQYGKILLRQNERQNCRQINEIAETFAGKLIKHLPFSECEISSAIEELLEMKVIHFEEWSLCQKRMIRDHEISNKRSKSGRKGAETTNTKKREGEGYFADDFAAAKMPANSEYENETLSLNTESLLMIKEENIGSNKRERKSKQITEPSEVVLLNPYCILSLDACKIELMRDQYWLEQITMSKHFSSVMETQVMLTQFFNKLKDDGVLQKSMTDAKKHFNSWIEYQKKNNNGDTKSKSATPRHDQAVAGLTSRMEELDRAFIAKQQQITN